MQPDERKGTNLTPPTTRFGLVNTFKPSQPYATWWKKRCKLKATHHQVWFGQDISAFSAFCTGISLMPPSTRFGWSIFFNLLSLMQPDERKETNLTPPCTRFGLVNAFKPYQPSATWGTKRSKLTPPCTRFGFISAFQPSQPSTTRGKNRNKLNATLHQV
jgi:hypothetical protein